MTHERTRCAFVEGRCLRCESLPDGRCKGGEPGLVLGAQDADADATLRAVLNEASVAYNAVGPVLTLPGGRTERTLLSSLLKERLSPYTQACIRAAYAAGGADTPEQVIAALLFAEPLTSLLQNMEHEWVREALNEDWLFSVFHPIVDAATGECFAQEALIRARDPHTGQTIGAGPIIQACEKLNLEHQLDQRARKSAIRGAAELNLQTKVFINFLPNTIYDPEICLRTTMEAAETHNIPLERLVFEVVETEHIPDMPRLRHILEYYRERGVGTAVDDMGAGFTSLEYLTALRPDYVKLDRDVVVEAEHRLKKRDQMRQIVHTAKDLGIRVIAEGIETPGQMQLCVQLGVDYLQGYLFARPACPPQTVNFPVAQLQRAA